jgi:predicted lysophospholipase L1 biosynthesis ABC-type transport system permease subunit
MVLIFAPIMVLQARLLRMTSEKRRISKWVWALLVLLAMSSFYGVLLIQGGSMIINLAFCGAQIVINTVLGISCRFISHRLVAATQVSPSS